MKQKKLLIIDNQSRNKTLSYAQDWYDTFRQWPDTTVDLITDSLLFKWGWKAYSFLLDKEYTAILVMHSVSSNLDFGMKAAQIIKKIKGPIFMFIGNEFKGIDQKIDLANAFGCTYVISQLPEDIATQLYGPHVKAKVISIPHALNERVFQAQVPIENRPIDVSYRGEKYPYYLGHDDRDRMFEFFKRYAENSDLKFDLGLGRAKGTRLNRMGWMNYLNNSKCAIASETGNEYLSVSDTIRLKVNDFEAQNPTTDFETVFNSVIKPLLKENNYLNGRAISSRHFDAIGCGTCLISFPGRFNDILEPEDHYIVLNPDFSNADDVISKIKNTSYLEKLAERTRTYVLNNHCLRHRVDKLMELIDQR